MFPEIYKALGHEVRIKIVKLLLGKNKPINQISLFQQLKLRMSRTAVQAHLNKLQKAKLIEIEHQGRQSLISVSQEKRDFLAKLLELK